MKIVIPGGSGQIGQMLRRGLAPRGHEIVIIGRGPAADAQWNGRSGGPWTRHLEGADVVINLAGRSVNCRYTAANRREILDSRVEATHAVGDAIARAARPPRLWLQASTATIYAHRFDAANDDVTGLLGGDEPDAPHAWRFSIEVAKAWERAAMETAAPETRLVRMRTAVVFSADRGGPFDLLSRLVRRGLGGAAGDGKQYVSWIHERDFVRAVEWLIAREDLSGAINLAAPNPLPNRDFMRALRAAWKVRTGLPAPAHWMLSVGALFLRTETELVLKSRRVVPRRLLDSGFSFDYPTWPEAARELAGRLSSP
jgi:uncharacterized protein (TIGR01777 family)